MALTMRTASLLRNSTTPDPQTTPLNVGRTRWDPVLTSLGHLGASTVEILDANHSNRDSDQSIPKPLFSIKKRGSAIWRQVYLVQDPTGEILALKRVTLGSLEVAWGGARLVAPTRPGKSCRWRGRRIEPDAARTGGYTRSCGMCFFRCFSDAACVPVFEQPHLLPNYGSGYKSIC